MGDDAATGPDVPAPPVGGVVPGVAGGEQEREQESVRRRLAELIGDGSGPEVALVDGLVERFPGKAERLVGAWAAALRAGRREEAVRHVHTLTGTALNLGSGRLVSVCRDVEERTVTACGPDVDGLHSQLRQESRRFAALLDDLVPRARRA